MPCPPSLQPPSSNQADNRDSKAFLMTPACPVLLGFFFFFLNFSVEDLYGLWLWSLQGQKDNGFMVSPESNNPGMHFPSLLLVIYF